MIDLLAEYRELKKKGFLEERLLERYLHAEHFKGMAFKDIKKMFDACERQKLHSASEQLGFKWPSRIEANYNNPLTLFRGCVGHKFRMGMSWTTDLFQAIKYPKRAKLFNWYGDDASEECSVWCALVEKDEVYCFLGQYEPEFIVCPKQYWKVCLPQKLFE